ncbi:MAG: VTC domain-containing protein [candidate division KSB1 bacterium]|nr:VTC domain-containing protein [candidate division KSB1 bacterium]
MPAISKAAQREKPAAPAPAYRYERKFFISGLTRHEVLALIKSHPAIFSEIYHERFVNNIYFDSLSLKNYFATVDGVQHRTKCRIRWYGELLGYIEKPVLEFKIKSGFVGRKETYPLASFWLDEDFEFATLQEVFRNSELPPLVRMDLAPLQPTLLNRYRRKYYQSADRNYRITVDSDMAFYRLKAYGNTFLHKTVDRRSIIVELKYSNEKDQFADLISGRFPFRVTRSSKYVNGIDALYPW